MRAFAYFASMLGTNLPTLAVVSSSGQRNIVVIQLVSVIPHTCVTFASGASKALNLACAPLSKGAAPHEACLIDLRECFSESGDMMMEMTKGGTTKTSVILNLSKLARYDFKSNRRMTKEAWPPRRGAIWIKGAAAMWNSGSTCSLRICII